MSSNFVLCPIATILQYFTDVGTVLAGGQIFTYLAGTSQPTSTFTDSTGAVANSNPIVLNSAGRLPNVSMWQQVGVPIKIVILDSNNNPIGGAIDQIFGINDPNSFGGVLTTAQVQTQINSSITVQVPPLIATGLQTVPGTMNPVSPAEQTANVTPTNYIYLPGDFRRYGGDGTGTNDSTAAINTALSIAQNNFAAPGTVFLSTGNHTMITGSTLSGPGKIKLTSGTNTLITIASISNTWVRGLTIDCSASTSASKAGIIINGSNNIDVDDCVLNSARVYTLGTCSYIRIRRNRASGSCVGGTSGGVLNIAVGGTCTNWVVEGNEVESSDGSGIEANNGASQGIINGNVCNSNAGPGIYCQSLLNCVVSNNVSTNNQQTGIGWNNNTGTLPQRSVISSNVCLNNFQDGFDINLSNVNGQFSYLSVIGNLSLTNGATNPYGCGFNIQFASLATFEGNIAFGNGLHGFLVYGGTQVTLIGNHAIANGSVNPGNTYNGISLFGANNCTIIGNICTNTSGGLNQQYGIQETGGANSNVIIGNNLLNNNVGALSLIGTQDCVRDNFPFGATNPTIQTITGNGQTINTSYEDSTLTSTGLFTGIILSPGTYPRQTCTVTNFSAGNSLTMAAAGISNVADGITCVITGLTSKRFVWLSNGTNYLWYSIGG